MKAEEEVVGGGKGVAAAAVVVVVIVVVVVVVEWRRLLIMLTLRLARAGPGNRRPILQLRNPQSPFQEESVLTRATASARN